jgi:hypothetical protein
MVGLGKALVLAHHANHGTWIGPILACKTRKLLFFLFLGHFELPSNRHHEMRGWKRSELRQALLFFSFIDVGTQKKLDLGSGLVWLWLIFFLLSFGASCSGAWPVRPKAGQGCTS